MKNNPKYKQKPAPKKMEQRQKQKKPAQQFPKIKANLFGFHAVSEAWLNPKRYIHALYMSEAARGGFEDILLKAQKKGLKRPQPVILDKQAIDKAFAPGTVHQGLALSAQDLAETSIQEIIIQAGKKSDQKECSLILILDQVTDPHNVGAILRSCAAFGVQGLVMQRKHAPEPSGILAKTACGAMEHVPIAYETNLTRTIETLKDAGYFVAGLDERGEDLRVTAKEKHEKLVLVLGAEGPGIRRLIKENCDLLLSIPMNPQMPSINVSNAAAVALYAFSGE